MCIHQWKCKRSHLGWNFAKHVFFPDFNNQLNDYLTVCLGVVQYYTFDPKADMSLFALDLPIRGFCFVSRHSTHVVKLCVRSHVSQMGHAVGQGEEGSNGRNVPNILSVKTVSLQGAEMFFSYCFTPADGKSSMAFSRAVRSATL